jgi:hypothetical protein
MNTQPLSYACSSAQAAPLGISARAVITPKGRITTNTCYTFTVNTYTTQPEKFAGKNTLFGSSRAKYFLLHYDTPSNFRVYTNHSKLRDFSFHSDRRNPSRKFIFNKFITGIFRFLAFHHRFLHDAFQRYFHIVSRHLHEQYCAIHRRLQPSVRNNNQTRTYFRFSVGQCVYYFGFYVPCNTISCCTPPTFVTRYGAHCWNHWKSFCRSMTPSPPLQVPREPTNIPKSIVCRRLGISYTKELSFSKKHNKLFVVYRDLNYLPNAKDKQLHRFDRLTRSSKSHDFQKLITSDKDHAVVACKHQPILSRTVSVPGVNIYITPTQLRFDLPPARTLDSFVRLRDRTYY